jgi:hypothetical protein
MPEFYESSDLEYEGNDPELDLDPDEEYDRDRETYEDLAHKHYA